MSGRHASAQTRPANLVDRHFARFRTDQLRVADFTYVWTWSGWVYVAFVFDAHSRRILSWRAATSMTTLLVLDCLDMALWTRRREGVAGFTGLTHHTDADSVYTSISFTDRLVDEGIDPFVGSVGDACDNSLAESQIGLQLRSLWGHMLGTAECSLCDITHSTVRRKPAWDRMVARMGSPIVALHRNELDADLEGAVRGVALPVVIAHRADGSLTVALDAADLASLGGSVDAFEQALLRPQS